MPAESDAVMMVCEGAAMLRCKGCADRSNATAEARKGRGYPMVPVSEFSGLADFLAKYKARCLTCGATL